MKPRTIEYTAQYKKDIKREKKGVYGSVLQGDFLDVITLLMNDTPLPEKYRDHALRNNWQGYRDCHVRPDFILIYKKKDISDKERYLYLIRIGSHSELGL